MTVLAVTRRPIVLETQASGAMLADLLARQETAIGRASLYGITDPVIAKLFTGESIEADFAGGQYRRGFVASSAVADLPSWTFTRAGAAVAATAGGGIVPFASGAPRITDAGLLVETAATNFIRYSQEIDNAAWSKVGSTTVTANQALAPDGTVTADRVQFAGGTSYFQQSAVGGGALTAGQPVTISFWARGSGAIGLRSGISGQGTTRTLAAAAQRFVWTFNAGGISEVVQITNNGLGGPVAGATPNADFYIWGFQLETGSFASSFVPTTSAAATRAKDDASFGAIASQGGFFVEADLPAHTPASAQILVSWSNGSNRHLTLYRNSANALAVSLAKPDGDVILTALGFGGARRVKAFVGWGEGQVVWTVGGIAQTPAVLPLPLSLTTVRPGSDRLNADKLSGTVHRLLTTTRLPTLAERIAMTA